jgi:hypothetical protein
MLKQGVHQMAARDGKALFDKAVPQLLQRPLLMQSALYVAQQLMGVLSLLFLLSMCSHSVSTGRRCGPPCCDHHCEHLYA